jgi:hypothetical protein
MWGSISVVVVWAALWYISNRSVVLVVKDPMTQEVHDLP